MHRSNDGTWFLTDNEIQDIITTMRIIRDSDREVANHHIFQFDNYISLIMDISEKRGITKNDKE